MVNLDSQYDYLVNLGIDILHAQNPGVLFSISSESVFDSFVLPAIERVIKDKYTISTRQQIINIFVQKFIYDINIHSKEIEHLKIFADVVNDLLDLCDDIIKRE